MVYFGGERILKLLTLVGWQEGDPIYHKRISRGIEKVQKKVEERNFEIRKSLLEYDEVMDYQRKIFYSRRRQVLEGKSLKTMIEEMIEATITNHCDTILDKEYPSEEWNIYPFHFSDGDNWSTDDTAVCLALLEKELIPRANVFCYGQVYSPYGSGQFLKDLQKSFEGEENLIMSEIRNKDGIVQSIKDFLGKGK